MRTLSHRLDACTYEPPGCDHDEKSQTGTGVQCASALYSTTQQPTPSGHCSEVNVGGGDGDGGGGDGDGGGGDGDGGGGDGGGGGGDGDGGGGDGDGGGGDGDGGGGDGDGGGGDGGGGGGEGEGEGTRCQLSWLRRRPPHGYPTRRNLMIVSSVVLPARGIEGDDDGGGVLV